MNQAHAVKAPNNDVVADQVVQPGKLSGDVWLTLQTYQAQQLVRGRTATAGKPAIIGLVGFADRLRVIWHAARSDDPYADWWLIQIHEAVQAIDIVIAERQAEVTQLLEQTTAVEATVARSTRPARVRLQFANPYAYQAARLLARYDEVVCTTVTLGHVGLLAPDSRRQIQHACARKLRALFVLPHGYRFFRIDRAAVHQRLAGSDAARHAMGEIPPEILSGEQQPLLAPRKIDFPTSSGRSMRTQSGGGPDPDRDDE